VIGNYAKKLGNMTEGAAIDEMMRRLNQTFPNINVPNPDSFHRSNWWRDEFARGSYSSPPVGVTPAMFDQFNKPVQREGISRMWFAGEANSKYRFSYADGAYAQGVIQAQAMLCAGT